MDKVSRESAPLATSVANDFAVIAATKLAGSIFEMAAGCDYDDAFPLREIEMLAEAGLLLAPFPMRLGGSGLGCGDDGAFGNVLDVLRILGGASLPIGRLFEGHLNAIAIVVRYGSEANLELLHREVSAGRLTGVWMAEASDGLRLDKIGDGRLIGSKIFCSGAGYIRRPLVAAALDGSAGPQMIIPFVSEGHRSSTKKWRVSGMKASATGDVDFSGLTVSRDELVGCPNDYYQSPYFRGGAWRVIAVQLGGIEKLFELYRAQMKASPQLAEGVQLARFGEAATDLETARLWVTEAASVAERNDADALAIDAYVDLARGAFESAAQGLMQKVQRGLGLRALIAPNPIERVLRDLTTYLRQPALDLSLTSAAQFVLQGNRLPTADRADLLST